VSQLASGRGRAWSPRALRWKEERGSVAHQWEKNRVSRLVEGGCGRWRRMVSIAPHRWIRVGTGMGAARCGDARQRRDNVDEYRWERGPN
jgi:hypothetical protein